MSRLLYKHGFIDIYSLLTGIIFGTICIVIIENGFPFSSGLITLFITTTSLLMTFQAGFSLYWMLYGWEDASHLTNKTQVKIKQTPHYSFTALIPARHESEVIAETIHAVDSMHYPEELKEILVVCRADDKETIVEVEKTIQSINKNYVRLIIFDTDPINKPHALNVGLQYAQNNIVVIFDAEDQPHPDIYTIANTEFLTQKIDVLQSGVQLMNFQSSWFSAFNVLEYYFWFKSTLHFFAKAGAVPLAGNTVFFKKESLQKIHGWDERCLTEDADIGIRLCNVGAKIQVVYDEQHVTKEETPPDLTSFIKQRTRWNQGFIQILHKGDWLKLPTITQKLLAGYILFLPELQSILFLLVPLSLFMAMTMKLPIIVTLLSYIPLFILLIQLVIQTVGLYEFSKNYNYKFPLWMPLKLLITFYPYQILLSISAFRAILRTLFGNIGWEKTLHLNAHRQEANVPIFSNI